MGQHTRLLTAYPPVIAATATRHYRRKYAANVVAAWHAASADQIERGRDWYPAAHRLGKELAGGDARMGAGVLAALSPQITWQHTVRLASDAFLRGYASGHFADACRKADRIMAGGDPGEILPADSKTWHFYRCIADPDDRASVVIDRHAHDIAVGRLYGNGNRGLDSKRRYATLAGAYLTAARRLGEIPSTVQAITWVAHIERTNEGN